MACKNEVLRNPSFFRAGKEYSECANQVKIMPWRGRRDSVADSNHAATASGEEEKDAPTSSDQDSPDKNKKEKKKVQIPPVPYKTRFSLAVRMEQVAAIKRQFPHKVPVVVERFKRERALPVLQRCKFLVPGGLNMAQFLHIIRGRLTLTDNTPVYLLVGGKSIASSSVTLGEVYDSSRDSDGFLYFTYASQEIFG